MQDKLCGRRVAEGQWQVSSLCSWSSLQASVEFTPASQSVTHPSAPVKLAHCALQVGEACAREKLKRESTEEKKKRRRKRRSKREEGWGIPWPPNLPGRWVGSHSPSSSSSCSSFSSPSSSFSSLPAGSFVNTSRLLWANQRVGETFVRPHLMSSDLRNSHQMFGLTLTYFTG